MTNGVRNIQNRSLGWSGADDFEPVTPTLGPVKTGSVLAESIPEQVRIGGYTFSAATCIVFDGMDQPLTVPIPSGRYGTRRGCLRPPGGVRPFEYYGRTVRPYLLLGCSDDETLDTTRFRNSGDSQPMENERTGDEEAQRDNSENPDEYTVLLADDHAPLRKMLRAFLTRSDGWDVREASNGREALEKLDRTVDVLLLDREMPNVSGSEVVERLHESRFRGSVVVLSGIPPDDRLSANAVETYLSKPTDCDEVVDELRRCIDR